MEPGFIFVVSGFEIHSVADTKTISVILSYYFLDGQWNSRADPLVAFRNNVAPCEVTSFLCK
jgi:hypothetical protein